MNISDGGTLITIWVILVAIWALINVFVLVPHKSSLERIKQKLRDKHPLHGPEEPTNKTLRELCECSSCKRYDQRDEQ